MMAVLDNAAYRKSAEAERFVRPCGNGITPLHLPPSTPGPENVPV